MTPGLSAGKNYLDVSALDAPGGAPAAINVYYTDSLISLTPIAGGCWMVQLPVLSDRSGPYIYCPTTPSVITGMTSILEVSEPT